MKDEITIPIKDEMTIEEAKGKIELWKDRYKREEKLRYATYSEMGEVRERLKEREKMNELLLKMNEQLTKNNEQLSQVIQKIIIDGEELPPPQITQPTEKKRR